MNDLRMIEPATWKEFRDAGLLWWVNRGLHLFGWAIVVEVEKEKEGMTIIHVYPARCRFRGFSPDDEDKGFQALTAHVAANSERLLAEAALPPSEGQPTP